MTRDALLDLLRTDAYRAGTFTLASGRTSDFFIDCKKVMLTAQGHRLIGEKLLAGVRALANARDVVAVAGVALGGCALASGVSLLSAMDQGPAFDALYVRKEAKDHGTRAMIEGRIPREGARVVLLEDVLTTGGSALRAMEQLHSAGLTVTAVLALVDRREGGLEALRTRGVEAQSLYAREDFVQGAQG